MTDKKTALVLGGTVPHVSLVKKLKERGFHTVLVDYLDNPPAREYADAHIKESTLDKEKVLEIARSLQASLVISTCVDQANSVCCYVSEKLGLPHPYSYRTSLDVTDKVRMKRTMWEHGIPTSRYVQVRSAEEALGQNLAFPLMVKPADSNSANGVKKVTTREELSRCLPEALKYSRNGYAIVEEFVEGMEISAYCIIVGGKAHLIMAQERFSVLDGTDKVIKCFASYAPARISEKAMAGCEEIATSIASAFGLDNTPLFFQGIVKGDDISVIEFAPRVGGGISSWTIRQGTGYDLIDAAIDSFLGKPVSRAGWHPMETVHAVNQIYGSGGVYDRTVGVEDLLDGKVVERISFYKKHGDRIDEGHASSARIGVMVFSARDDKELRAKVGRAFKTLDCISDEGRSMIRRDLNLDALWNLIN